MRLSGANTYEGTQIGNEESKWNLNCYNRDGKLKGYNYKIEFDVPKLSIYQREYDCLDINAIDTSSKVSREELRYYYNDDAHVSGIAKPSCSLFLDTTKFKSSTNYCKKIEELSTYTIADPSGVRSQLVGDEILEAVKNFASSAEVYRDVEISVSFSGAYGESGMTKFRITSNMLHFFVVVQDLLRYENDPNYKYINVYVKYASIETPLLMQKIELEDLFTSYGNSINLKVGDDARSLYTSYSGYEIKDYNGNRIDETNTNRMLNGGGSRGAGDIHALIYSGLFQFEDESRVNPSWFVTNTVTSVGPLVNVETHTYISAEDYDIERNVNEYLDDAYNTADYISSTFDNLPLITSDSHAIEFIDEGVTFVGNFTGISIDKYKWSTRLWSEFAGPGAATNTIATLSTELGIKNNSTLVRNIYEGNKVSDIYDGADLAVKNFKASYAGQYIIQYITDDAGDQTLVYTSEVIVSNSQYSVLAFTEIETYLSDDYDLIIDIWWNPTVGETLTDQFYRVFSINIDDTYAYFTANYSGDKATFTNEYSLIENAMRNTTLAYDSGSEYFSRAYGYAGFEDSETGSDGLFICISPGGLTTDPDNYTVGTLVDNGPPASVLPISDELNVATDIADVLYDPDGRFDDDYNTYINGVSNIPQYKYPKWRIDVRHIEEYDGRLWLSSKDKCSGISINYTVDSIVTGLPSEPGVGDTYCLQNTNTNSTIKVGIAIEPTPTYTTVERVGTLPTDGTLYEIGDDFLFVGYAPNEISRIDNIIGSVIVWTYLTLFESDIILNEGDGLYYRYDAITMLVDSYIPSQYDTTTPSIGQYMYNVEDKKVYEYKLADTGYNQFIEYEECDYEYRDLYYSEQANPEMVLETNYKGYNANITDIKEFIEQLYVFQDTQVDIVRKNLTREIAGIVEPTYQYHKSFDKGAIEFTVKEYEKKLFFTNSDGMFYIDAGGNYNKVSENIDRLFTSDYITSETVDYGEINRDFYVIKMTKEGRIPLSFFSELELTYSEYKNLYVEYIAYNIRSNTFWFGNDATGTSMYFYMTKDFTQRNKYENVYKKKQMKRISTQYDNGNLKVSQIRNKRNIIGEFWYDAKDSGMPSRHTLRGYRNMSYSFLISANFMTEIIDFAMLENGK